PSETSRVVKTRPWQRERFKNRRARGIMSNDFRMLIRPSLIFLAFATLGLPCNAAPVDFAREIRPLFSENCFACHGPDSNKRKAGSRLDQKESAFGKAESGEIAIVPEDLEKSELLRRVASTDKDEVMPPPKE